MVDSDLRVAPCDKCGVEADCRVRLGKASLGEPKRTTWFLQPPGWWAAYYVVPNGPRKGTMMILSRCPNCIDEVAPPPPVD